MRVFFEPQGSLQSILEVRRGAVRRCHFLLAAAFHHLSHYLRPCCWPQEEKDCGHVSTKLGCTLGPQSRSVEVLEQLLLAGMTVRRWHGKLSIAQFSGFS